MMSHITVISNFRLMFPDNIRNTVIIFLLPIIPASTISVPPVRAAFRSLQLEIWPITRALSHMPLKNASASTSLTPFWRRIKNCDLLMLSHFYCSDSALLIIHYFKEPHQAAMSLKIYAARVFAPRSGSRPSHGRGQLKQIDYSNNQISLVSSGCPGGSVLLIALTAVNRPGSIRLEGDLGLLPAFWTGNICHFSRTTIVAASAAAATTTVFIFSLKHLSHVPFESIHRIETATENISTNRFDRRNAASYKGRLSL